MINKNLILICIICMFLTCSNLLAHREFNRDKTCHSNIRVLLGAIEMYNMDHPSTPIKILDEESAANLLKEGYLKTELSKPEKDCHLMSIGDLTKDGIVYCKYHGDLDHLIYCDYYKYYGTENHKKLPQDTTIEEIRKYKNQILEERKKLIEKAESRIKRENTIKDILNWILVIVGVITLIPVIKLSIDLFKISFK